MKQEKGLLRQGILLSLMAVIASLVSFAKEAVFANYFGVSAEADAYNIAIIVPEILFAVVWEGINSIVIPLYTDKLYKEGKKAADCFISSLFAIIGSGTIVLVIIMEVFADGIVAIFSPGLTAEVHSLAVQLIRRALPILFFEGIIRICVSVLHVQKKFALSRILGGIRNLGVIAFLSFFASRFGIAMAVYGLLSGVFIECCIYVFFVAKHISLGEKANFRDVALKRAARMLVPVLIGGGVSEINQIADKVVASFLGTGSIAALNYASKLNSIIQSLILMNIITIMYPEYSVLASKKKYEELAKAYQNTIKICILISMPIVFGGIFLRNELVSLAFERGAFDNTSVLLVGRLFAIYLVSGLFLMIRQAGVKLFTACCDTRTTMINSIVGVTVNIVLNIILSCFWGAEGLAAATAISLAVTSIRLMMLAKRKLPCIQYKETTLFSVKVLMATVGMNLVLWGMKYCLKNIEIHLFVHKFLFVVGMIVVGAIVYGILLLCLKTREVKEVLRSLIKK